MNARRRPVVAFLGSWLAMTVLVMAASSWWDAASHAEAVERPALDTGGVDGEAIWNRDCASCHGRSGDGTGWGPSLQDKGPAGVA